MAGDKESIFDSIEDDDLEDYTPPDEEEEESGGISEEDYRYGVRKQKEIDNKE